MQPKSWQALFTVAATITFFGCIGGGASFAAAAKARCSYPEIAADPAWHRLLHYTKTWRGQFESRADGGAFFLADNGKFDPCAEVEATISAMETGRLVDFGLSQSAVCAFPARRRYLEAALGRTFKSATCSDWDEWREGINAASVTVVYSSAYANHPASMFGHLLVRLDPKETGGTPGDRQLKGQRQKRDELLGYGVNFAAITNESDRDFMGVAYAFRGLFGGYEGRFAVAPYYMKVNEYNNAESRDLWELRLALSDSQVDMLVEHLWELYANTYFDYFFLDENCAYQILAWLDTANPAWNLAESTRKPTPPSDAVRVLAKVPGLIESVQVRPSNYRVVLQRFHDLPAEARQATLAVAAQKRDVHSLHDAASQDALLELLIYRKYALLGAMQPSDQMLLHQALRLRAQHTGTEGAAEPLVAAPNNRPDLGAPAALVGLGWLRREAHNLATFSWSPGYHALLADDTGYEPWSATEYLATTVAFDGATRRRGKLRRWLAEMRLLEVLSMRPLDRLDPKASWRLLIAARSQQGWSEPDANYDGLKFLGGIGGAFHLGTPVMLAYGFAQAFAERRWTPDDTGYGAGPALASGILLTPRPWLKFQAGFDVKVDLLAENRLHVARSSEFSAQLGFAKDYELALRAHHQHTTAVSVEVRRHY